MIEENLTPKEALNARYQEASELKSIFIESRCFTKKYIIINSK